MKKIISLLLLISVTVCLFAGCEAKKSGVKIGLAAPAATHGWVAGASYYAEKYCKENQINYELTTSSNAEEMEKDIDALIENGAEALVVWPQWSGMETKVKEISQKEGIPVVSFDVDIGYEGIYKVTGNNYEMGYQCAKYITDKVGDSASVLVFEVPSAGSVSALRKKGFDDYLAEKQYDIKNIIYVSLEGFTREAGYEAMKEELSANEKIDAVFSMDDEVSIGVVRALDEAKRTDVRAVTGGGGMQEYFKMIADKKYASYGLSSALYSPSMIEGAIEAAVKLAAGETASRMTVMPTKIVTAENAAEYIDPQNTVY